MCGIAGIFHLAADRPVDRAVLDRMTDALAHRGPDGRGTHVDGSLGLGHRRLSIIDLSNEAAQPMPNEDRTVWTVFNGEIYNFRDLRRGLESRGHTFRSQTDSEVLVHLYEDLGPRLVDRLRGMFAFALWDQRQKRLLLARDRFGQKPLYYSFDGRSFRFGSEIKAILQDPEVPREPDLESLDLYLTYGYVPGPRTAFVGIKKLLPGHILVISADGSQETERYWRLPIGDKHSLATPADRARAQDRVRELVDEATRLRLVSDVPLGAFLSGGIDSSAVVSSMCSTSTLRPRTFCIGFDRWSFDESPHAERVASHLGTNHRTLELTEGAIASLERVAWHYGEPFADSSCLPTFALSSLARQHVTVALTGDGGDELFAGYRRHIAAQREERFRRGSSLLRAAARSKLTISMLRRARRKSLARELDHNRLNARLAEPELYVSRLETLSPALKNSLYSDDFGEAALSWNARRVVLDAIAASEGESLAERCTDADVSTYLPDDILTKVDVASMAHGLECRAPLLDHVLAEYVAGLPFAFKVDGSNGKAILKDAFATRLPAETLQRNKKGFTAPLGIWLEGRFKPLMLDTLLSSRAVERGYFDKRSIKALIEDHLTGHSNHQTPLFCLLMQELWHRLWIDPPQGQELPKAGELCIRGPAQSRLSPSGH